MSQMNPTTFLRNTKFSVQLPYIAVHSLQNYNFSSFKLMRCIFAPSFTKGPNSGDLKTVLFDQKYPYEERRLPKFKYKTCIANMSYVSLFMQ